MTGLDWALIATGLVAGVAWVTAHVAPETQWATSGPRRLIVQAAVLFWVAVLLGAGLGIWRVLRNL